MKPLLAILFALAAMAAAMLVVTLVFHLDPRAELRKLMPEGSPIDGILPEA